MAHTSTTHRLFTTTRLGALELPNKLVMAPMNRTRATADGTPTPLMATYYAQRASAGLIIAESTTPSAVGATYPNIPALYREAHVAGWRRVTDAVTAAGGRMFLQIEHGGRVGHPHTSGFTPLAPSPVALPEPIHTPRGKEPAPVPREMTDEQIGATIADFATAARRAIRAGFAGVEVHAANGYLLHQFLSQNTNHRIDGYGGSISNRIRFVVEVVRAVTAAIGARRVGVRISPGYTGNGIVEGDTDQLYPELVEQLSNIDPVYLHVAFADPDQAVFQDIRKRWSGTLIANPALPWPGPLPADAGRSAGERLLVEGADLVALGRGFLANPDLVERLQADAPLNPVREQRLMYSGGPAGYIDYPTRAGGSR